MFDVWSVVGWWEDWQLRVLVLGSLGLQWFLMVAAPMRKYTVWPCLRKCIWLAYISSDALAIYALATLFNRHARASSGGSRCEGGIASDRARILEVLWAPVLLIHLGGQEELTAYTIEDNELWTRHAVTLVSQVSVAMYAFYKSWPNPSDRKLLASAILLFVIGVVSFSEKPWALNKASINRLASVSATIQGTQKRTRLAVYLDDLLFSDWYNCFARGSGAKMMGGNNNNSSSNNLPEGVSWYRYCFSGTKSSSGDVKEDPAGNDVGLSDADKVYMVLSDMSLSAAADDLVLRGRAGNVHEVLRPLSIKAEKELKRWLRGAFGLIYTRANLVFTHPYLVYHVLVVPVLHVAALALFVVSDKRAYDGTDVKITYVLFCLTAALDVFAVFIRQLLYKAMSATSIPALCETVPGYNLMEAVLRRRRRNKAIGWLVKRAAGMGCNKAEEYLDCGKCSCEGHYTPYDDVSKMVLADLVDAQGRDLANYRVFTVPYGRSGAAADHERPAEHDVEMICSQEEAKVLRAWRRRRQGAGNWALSEEQQKECGPKIRSTLRGSFDRSVLVWHIATDLCFRLEVARHDASDDDDDDDDEESDSQETAHGFRIRCTAAISSYMARLLNSHPDMLLTGSREHLVSEAMDEFESILRRTMADSRSKTLSKDDLNKIIDHVVHGEEGGFRLKVPIGDDEVPIAGSKPEEFHIPEACSLAKELLALPPSKRWSVMYRVWLGMLFYSASMCRGYLHAKSLGEGGEFLSYVWLVLSLKGAKTLADKLQMLEGSDQDDEEPKPDRCPSRTDLNLPDASIRSPTMP